VDNGITIDEATKTSSLIVEAKLMLKDWEDGKADVRELWKTMNSWVYNGFYTTYERMGDNFRQSIL